MSRAEQIVAVASVNLRRWRDSVHVWLAFALAFIVCMLLTGKAIGFAMSYGTTLQIMETFVWTFGDATSIMLMSLLLVLLFAGMPFAGSVTPYCLMRVGRGTWLAGQVLYSFIMTVIFIAFILAVTIGVSAHISFTGNVWSETGAILAFSGAAEEVLLPASLKTMILSDPYQCAANIFVLTLLYFLFLVSMMLAVSVRHGRKWGAASVFIASIYGLALSPDIFVRILRLPDALAWRANVLTGWLSPLNQATYHMHNFGYDYLPGLPASYAIFAALICLCVLIAARGMKRCDFRFAGVED
jgi:hypothetical protein